MYYFIFIIEIVLILFYIDMEYGTSTNKYTQKPNENYSAYYYIDVVDNEILNLKQVPPELQMEVWKASTIQHEVLSHFPNMHAMNEVYNDRIEDDGLFKAELLEKIQTLQDAYIAGELNEEQFKKAFLSLD